VTYDDMSRDHRPLFPPIKKTTPANLCSCKAARLILVKPFTNATRMREYSTLSVSVLSY